MLDRKAQASEELAPELLPRHVAIIMDGNRRWAREHRYPIVEGYRRGMTALREITRACGELGVSMLTAYAFSSENWKRPQSEVSLLFDLCCAFARNELDGLRRENVRVRVMGRYEELPRVPREALETLVARTATNDGVALNLAVNYSARIELCDAIKALAGDVRSGAVNPENIDEKTLDTYLYTAGLPDPDLLIRPGGECRLSNFLLYQSAYAELWMTDLYWPEFTRAHFRAALADFARRKRRFGGS